MVSPGRYIEPSGFSQYFWLSGHALKKSRLPWIELAVRGRIGKPCSAYWMARAETCSNDIEPHFSSTVNAECSAPGITDGSSPSPSSVLFRDLYHSIDAPFGAQPWPTIDVTFFSLIG